MALPVMESMRSRRGDAQAASNASSVKRMVVFSNAFGMYPSDFFPKEAGFFPKEAGTECTGPGVIWKKLRDGRRFACTGNPITLIFASAIFCRAKHIVAKRKFFMTRSLLET